MRSYSVSRLLLASLVVIVLGCGGDNAPVPTGTAQPVGSAMPSAMSTVAASPTAPSIEPTVEPTTVASPSTVPSAQPLPTPESVCTGDGSGGTLRGELTLWYAPTTEAEATTMRGVLADTVCTENPALKVNLLALDPGNLVRAYAQNAAQGKPDVLVAPNDALRLLADQRLITNLTKTVDASKFNPLAIVASTYTTKGGEKALWQVPRSIDGVALFYDKSRGLPPASTDALMTAVEDGSIAVGIPGGETSAADNVAWWAAFGGKLVDDSGRCVADTTGVDKAFAFLQNLKGAGAKFYAERAAMAADLAAKQLDMAVDSSSAAAGYAANVDNLAIAPLPAGPSGPASPWLTVTGYSVNSSSANPELALAFAQRMVQADVETIFANNAYDVPATADVPAPSNPISAQLMTALAVGFMPPETANLDAFAGPFGSAMLQLLDEGADPASAASDACRAMNEANGL